MPEAGSDAVAALQRVVDRLQPRRVLFQQAVYPLLPDTLPVAQVRQDLDDAFDIGFGEVD